MSSSSLGKQIDGEHYTRLAIQPAEYNHKNDIPFLPGTAIKYITRSPYKGEFKTDIEKAIHCLEMYLEFENED